jgi:hypothetical protein
MEIDFTNDGLGWGFIPEWDDYETYSMNARHDWENWNAAVTFLCYTDRAQTEAESSRIDCIQLEVQGKVTVIDDVLFNMELRGGGIIRSFNDYQGLFIQTEWHSNVEVHRDVPTGYEDPFFQFLFPFSAEVLSPMLPWVSLKAELIAGWPLELTGKAELDVTIPEEILPLRLRLGYGESIIDSPSRSYTTADEMKKGLYIGSKMDFWPFFIKKEHYFNHNWGKGSIGVRINEPAYAYPENIINQLIISGITHQAYGMKIGWNAFPDVMIENLNTGFTYTAISGWLDAPLTFPQGGRYSEISLGVEPFYCIKPGDFRIDPFLMLNIGIRQNSYYELATTALTPFFTETTLILETGGGLRFLFPFFHDRFLGFTIDGLWEWPLLSTNDLPKTLPDYRRFKVKMSVTVTGNQ